MSASDFVLDVTRSERIGFAEAIYAAGKSPAQLAAILDRVAEGKERLLLTRLDEAKFAALPERQRLFLDYDPVSRTAFRGEPPPLREPVQVAILTAGTSDVPVAREAARVLRFHGRGSTFFADIGVAGLWRLMARIEEIRAMPVVIVVAGMDAALPSVVGGLVPGVVIAVPSSVGYGVAEGGAVALNAALASCAPGVTVVNIDNGYGAAAAALRHLNALARDEALKRVMPVAS